MPNLPKNIVSGVAIVQDVTDYKNAVKAVAAEYKSLILGGSCGAANFEATYAEYIGKLHAAGVDQLIELHQEFLDDYR